MKKAVVTFTLCIVFVFSLFTVSFAAVGEPAPASPGIEVGTSIVNTQNESMGIAPYAITSIHTWYNGISKSSSTKVSCSSTTVSSGVSDKLEVVYTLYQYKNGAWKSYGSTTHSRTNTSLLNDNATFTVASGYSYYIHTTHRAYSVNSVCSSKTASSSSIYV